MNCPNHISASAVCRESWSLNAGVGATRKLHTVSTRLAKQLKPVKSTRKSARQEKRTSRRTGHNGSGSSSESSQTEGEGKPTSGDLSSSGNLEASRSKRVPCARESRRPPLRSAPTTQHRRRATCLQTSVARHGETRRPQRPRSSPLQPLVASY